MSNALRLIVTVYILTPATAHAAITSEGDVFISGGNPAGNVVVGQQFDGTLTVTPPDVLTTQGITVAENRGVVGTVLVDGGGLDIIGGAVFGNRGVADVTVQGGGAIRYVASGQTNFGDNGLGFLTVTGPGSLADLAGPFSGGHLLAADTGRAEVLVDDGGELRTGASSFGGAGTFPSGSASIEIRGPSSSWAYGRVTELNNTELTIRDGAQLLATGLQPGSSPLTFGQDVNAQITGAGSLFVGDDVTIGAGGRADVRVDDSADVDVRWTSLGGDRFGSAGDGPSDFGVLELDGFGTTWRTGGLFLGGANGGARLTIKNGAHFVDEGSQDVGVRIAERTGSHVVVTIDGPNSTWTSADGSLGVGLGGRGELRILNGAHHENGFTVIGNRESSEVRVAGTDSRWNVRDALWINNGRLTVADGGAVQLPFNSHVLGQGAIQLDGGALLGRFGDSGIQSTGRIGGDGVIEANIENNQGGLVNVGPGEILQLDRLTNNFGAEVNVEGGELRTGEFLISGEANFYNATLRSEFVEAAVNVGAGGRLRFLGGENHVHGRVSNRLGDIVITGDSQVTFFDEVIGQGDGVIVVNNGASATFLDESRSANLIGGGTVRFEGEVVVDLGGIQTHDVDAEFTATASLRIPVLDTRPNPFMTEGQVELGGRLILDLFANQVPGIHQLVVVESDNLVDEFDSVPEVGSFISQFTRFLGIDYTPTSAIVTVENLTPGDANGDGLITTADFEAWADEHGAGPAALTLADANGDGMVNAADYTAIRDAMDGDNHPIPEPGALPMAALVLAGLSLRRGARVSQASRRDVIHVLR